MDVRPSNDEDENYIHQPVTLDLRLNAPSALSNNNIITQRSIKSIRFLEPEENSLQKDGLSNLSPLTLHNLDKNKSSQRYLTEEGVKKSRGLFSNSPVINKKYEYGDEGVKVTEEVVEKYKASNYVIQRDMLQKFKKEAEEFRRNRRPKQNNSSPYQPRESQELSFNPNASLQNLSFIQQQHQDNMKKYQYQLQLLRRNRVIQEEELRIKQMEAERLREKERRKKLRKAAYIKREKENLVNVGNMLREINHKIKQNSQQISSNLHRLREELNKSKEHKPRHIILRNDRFFSDQLDFQNLSDKDYQEQKHINKLPVILYNDKYSYSKSYASDNKTIERINRDSCKASADNIKNVINILRKNERRIELLSSLKPEDDN